MALTQLAAVRNSGSDSPVAADAIRELCRAASGADAAVRAAVASLPAGGQLGSVAAAAVAVRLGCLETALRVLLPAKMAVGTQLEPVAHSASQLATTVLQCAAFQVHTACLPDSRDPCVCPPARFWLVSYCSSHQQLAALLVECRTNSSALFWCCSAAGRRCCPACSSAPVHHGCMLWRMPASGCAACHGDCIPPRRGALRLPSYLRRHLLL